MWVKKNKKSERKNQEKMRKTKKIPKNVHWENIRIKKLKSKNITNDSLFYFPKYVIRIRNYGQHIIIETVEETVHKSQFMYLFF